VTHSVCAARGAHSIEAMTPIRPLVVISLRRLLTGAAALTGAVLTLAWAVGAAAPARDGAWSALTGLTRLFAGGATAAAVPAATGQGAPSFGLVTLMVVPTGAGRAATLFRDGLAAGQFGGGPLTVAVRSGDVLAVRVAAGGPPAQVRVLAVSRDVVFPEVQEWPLRAGGTLSLARVRLAAAAGPS